MRPERLACVYWGEGEIITIRGGGNELPERVGSDGGFTAGFGIGESPAEVG